MSDAYSPAKALRHLDIIEGARAGRPVRPAHIHLVVSDACQQRCSFCAYKDPAYPSSQRFLPADGSAPRRMMAYEKALEVLDDCREMGCQAIQFTGGGEPTTHPRFGELLAACSARGLSYAVVTNGGLVEQHGLAEGLARATWVRFSLDTADPAEYAAIRGVSEWQHAAVCSSIRAVRDARDKLASGCTIGLSCIVGPHNWRSVVPLVRLARALGVDNVSLAPQFSAGGLAVFAGCLDDVLAVCQEAEALAGPGFQVFNRVPARIEDIRAGSPSFRLCGYSLFVPYVAADLNVYRCCTLAYNDAGLVGSIADQRFRDLWMSEARAAAMTTFDARSCERCPYHAQGRLLEYVLSPEEPTHADFV